MTAIYSTTVFLEKVTWSETEIDAEQMILWETTNSDQSEVSPWTYKKGQRQQYHPPCMRSLSDSNDHAPGLNWFLFPPPPPSISLCAYLSVCKFRISLFFNKPSWQPDTHGPMIDLSLCLSFVNLLFKKTKKQTRKQEQSNSAKLSVKFRYIKETSNYWGELQYSFVKDFWFSWWPSIFNKRLF